VRPLIGPPIPARVHHAPPFLEHLPLLLGPLLIRLAQGNAVANPECAFLENPRFPASAPLSSGRAPQG
jgi:hypothetical protein